MNISQDIQRAVLEKPGLTMRQVAEAIGRGDLDAIMEVWADDEEIVCIHPTGQRLSGASAIRESWQTIFSSNTSLTVHVKRAIGPWKYPRWIEFVDSLPKNNYGKVLKTALRERLAGRDGNPDGG